jgi:hypothetical protein
MRAFGLFSLLDGPFEGSVVACATQGAPLRRPSKKRDRLLLGFCFAL